MARPAIQTIKLSDSLSLSEYHRTSERPQGWWLYDKTRGMNLAMGAETKEAALLKALQYYQKRLSEVEASLNSLQNKVDHFVGQFIEIEEEV
jgi:hypothetical protein